MPPQALRPGTVLASACGAQFLARPLCREEKLQTLTLSPLLGGSGLGLSMGAC